MGCVHWVGCDFCSAKHLHLWHTHTYTQSHCTGPAHISQGFWSSCGHCHKLKGMRHTADSQGSKDPAGGLLGFMHSSTLGSVFGMALNMFPSREIGAKENLIWMITEHANDFATHITPRPTTCCLYYY